MRPNPAQVSYTELSEASGRFGNALRRLGCARGDAAIVITGRSPEWCGRRLDGGAVLPKRLTALGLVFVCGNPMRGSRAESITVEHESAALAQVRRALRLL
jgi:hypothetical protein